MTALWTAADIAAATRGTASGAFAAHGVSIDSRTVQPGDLFIALVGPNHDGHAHVAAALGAGAAGALVHTVPGGVAEDRLVVVHDTFTALQDLGKAARDRFTGRVVGVTGSVGKTSTKEMLARVLGEFGTAHAPVGSFNNHWGVPLTLARIPRGADTAVIEMGMNHPGEIRVLTAMSRPHVAVITTVAAAHLEHFASTAEIAEAKAEILDGVEPGGTAILPRDNPHYGRLRAAAEGRNLKVLAFGEAEDADARLIDVAVDGDRTQIFAMISGQKLSYTVGAPGRHWAQNSLAVLAAVSALGLDPARAAAALIDMTPPKGRGQRHRVALPEGAFTLVDESYNANPTSVEAALAALAGARPEGTGRRVAVLGDMLELGPAAADMHAALSQEVVARGIDVVYTAGPLMAHLHDALPPGRRGAHAADSARLASTVAGAVRPGDVVMVKGSAGSRMGRVVDALLALDTAGPTRATAAKT